MLTMCLQQPQASFKAAYSINTTTPTHPQSEKDEDYSLPVLRDIVWYVIPTGGCHGLGDGESTAGVIIFL